jgi:hypothetical protein
MHLTPAGFPSGIPGMGDEMEGAIQHAPQRVLQSIAVIPNSVRDILTFNTDPETLTFVRALRVQNDC